MCLDKRKTHFCTLKFLLKKLMEESQMIQVYSDSDCFMLQNRFVDEYLCEANGSFVKVFLFVLRHQFDKNLELADIANALNLLESDVIRAFKYWHKMGLIKFNHTGENDFYIEFIKESGTLKTSSPNINDEKTASSVKSSTMHTAVSYSKSDINTYMKNNDGIRHMFLISEQLLNRSLTDTDRKILFSFYDYLGMPVEVIFTLLEYCISIGKSNMRYIEKVAYSWADKNINTLAKASIFVKEETEFSNTLKKFKNLFKITGREFTSTEEAYIRNWVYEQKLTDDIIKNAYETTVTNTGKIAFKYMDAILKNSTSADFTKPTTASTGKMQKKNSFQDYDNDITDFDIQLIKNRINKQ